MSSGVEPDVAAAAMAHPPAGEISARAHTSGTENTDLE